MTKTQKIIAITIPLLFIGGYFAFGRKKNPAPAPKKKPATIIIGDTTGGIDPFAETGNLFYTKEGATMWSYPATVGTDLIKTYGADVSMYATQTGAFATGWGGANQNWYEVDDMEGNVGWIKESDLY